MKLRAARVIAAPLTEVRAAASRVSSTAHLVQTGAGVLVTLERRRGLLHPRRRTLRALARDLDTVRNQCESHRNQFG